MDKRGQIIGQVFIYIMAVIVIGAIALIGYNAIKGTMNKSCQVEQLTFKSYLEQMIERYSSFGDVKKESLAAPCSYQTVCFVDADSIDAKTPNSCPTNKIISNSVQDGVKTNIFVVSGSSTLPIGYSNLIKTTPACLCIKAVNNNFQLVFRGQGSKTEISSS